MRLPGLGALTQQSNVAILARTLGTLLRHGVPLVAAMQIAAAAAPNRRMRRAVMAAAEAVKEGEGLTSALRETAVFPDLALQFIAIGEESSKLDAMLLHLATIVDKDHQRRLGRLMTLLTPAITVVIGLVVGTLILSVMQAILGVNDLVLR